MLRGRFLGSIVVIVSALIAALVLQGCGSSTSSASTTTSTTATATIAAACPSAVEWDSLNCTRLSSRSLTSGQSTAGGWQTLDTDPDVGSWWTTRYSSVRDGGSGRQSCGGDCNNNTALRGGGQWRPNPRGYKVPDVRIWGHRDDTRTCGPKPCAFLASLNTFSFGSGDEDVYTLDFDVTVYGENCNAWYAVWLDPVCWTEKCDGLGAHMTEIDLVENIFETSPHINFDTCVLGPGTCGYVGGQPPLDGLPSGGEGPGSCVQVQMQDSTTCRPGGDTKEFTNIGASQLDHHISVQWTPRGPEGQDPSLPPNGKVNVSVCNRELLEERKNTGACSCPLEHATRTIGPMGWADSQYKLVLDIWGVEFEDDTTTPTCAVELTNVRFLNKAGVELNGHDFTPDAPPAYGVCDAFYQKYPNALDETRGRATIESVISV